MLSEKESLHLLKQLSDLSLQSSKLTKEVMRTTKELMSVSSKISILTEYLHNKLNDGGIKRDPEP